MARFRIRRRRDEAVASVSLLASETTRAAERQRGVGILDAQIYALAARR